MNTIAFRTVMQDGTPILFGALCDLPVAETRAAEIQRALENRILPNVSDPFLVDFSLMRVLQSVCGTQDFLAAAASVSVPGMPDRTGGVIGSLGEYDSPQEYAQPQALGKGFGVVSLPGRFGVICRYKLAQTISDRVEAEDSGSDTALIQSICRLCSGTPFLIVSDGSGPDAHGKLIASDGAAVYGLSLDGSF